MTNKANRVSYGAAAEEVVDLFDDYFTGSSSRPFLVVATSSLGDSAANALKRSLSTLGYQDPAYSLIIISPAERPSLDADALRLLIEGVDPYRLISADETATETLSIAYRTQLTPNAINRIMGRSCGVFTNLNELVQGDTTKYLVWEIFKALK